MRFAWVLVLVAACEGSGEETSPDAAIDATSDDAPGEPTADQLRSATAICTVIGGKYKPGSNQAATIDICGATGVVFWTADLDVDCDGKETAQCSVDTDPDYLSSTAASDSHGDPLDAAALPFVVLPGASTKFTYADHALGMRSVVAVVYADKVVYGVAGDVGPKDIIGEASYAMADALGIDPDPSTGGTAEPVLYIAFTGAASKVTPIEDHAAATTLGIARARDSFGL
ncbi:glycoside hydrolase family 75 protein [soil metagenome]